MEDDILGDFADAMGVPNDAKFAKAVALQGIADTTMNLGMLMLFVHKYKVFTVEGTERMRQAMMKYIADIEVILGAEQAIDSLREPD